MNPEALLAEVQTELTVMADGGPSTRFETALRELLDGAQVIDAEVSENIGWVLERGHDWGTALGERLRSGRSRLIEVTVPEENQ